MLQEPQRSIQSPERCSISSHHDNCRCRQCLPPAEATVAATAAAATPGAGSRGHGPCPLSRRESPRGPRREPGHGLRPVMSGGSLPGLRREPRMSGGSLSQGPRHSLLGGGPSLFAWEAPATPKAPLDGSMRWLSTARQQPKSRRFRVIRAQPSESLAAARRAKYWGRRGEDC